MSDNDTARFRLEAEASGFDQAIEKVERLTTASERAEKSVRALQQAVVEAANKTGMGGSTILPSFQSFQRLSNARYDNNPNLMPPEVAAPLRELHEQQSQDKATRQVKQHSHQENVRDAMGRQRDRSGRFVSGAGRNRQQQSWFLHVARTIGSTRSLNQMGAFASGEEGPLMVNMASLLAQHMLGTHNPIAAYHRGTRALATGAANAIKAPDLFGMPGGAAMGMGQQMMAASMERMLPIMLNPLLEGAILAGIVSLVMNNLMSKQITTDANLRANVAGAQSISDPLRDQLMHMAQNQFHYDKNTVFQTAMQMGTAGVNAKQMPDAMKLTLAMARLTGQQPSQIGQMTSTMMVEGGKSVDQVKDAFLNMRDAAEKSNVPLSKMIDSFNTLSQATGGAAVNVAGLAQLQAQLGPGINAGNLISPLVGSFGFQSMLQSNMLGVPLSQFVNDQQRPEKLMSLVGNFSKDMFGGQNTLQNQEFLGGMLNSMGLLNTNGIPPNLLRPLMSSLISGNMADFQKAAKGVSSYEKANPEAGKTFEQQMADLAGGETPWITQMLQKLDTMANDLTTMVNTWMPILAMLLELLAVMFSNFSTR